MVPLFLLKLRNAFRDGAELVIWERGGVTRQTMAELELTDADVVELLCRLTETECIDGPEDDRRPERGGAVAEFKTRAEGSHREVYVKVKVVVGKEQTAVECLSFHF